jgi:two-component sensor histidine kinase
MGIGTDLIKSLTSQIEGKYDIENKDGVCVTIKFNTKTY